VTRTLLGWVCGIVLLITVWWLVSLGINDRSLLPTPYSILAIITREFEALFSITVRTAVNALLGLTLAMFAAILLVVLVGAFPKAEVLVYPYIVMLKATPAVAFAPLLVVLIGSGPWVKIVVAALIAFFPAVIGGIDGIKRTPERLLVISDAYGCSRWTEFRHVVCGFAIAGFFSGMKTSAPLAVVGAIVGEFVDATAAGKSGIGLYIASHARYVYMDQVFAGVVMATTLGLTFFITVAVFSHYVDRRLRLER